MSDRPGTKNPANPAVQKLQVISSRSERSGIGSKGGKLSGIFIELVALQQQFGKQVLTLEEGIQQQRQELVNAMDQLPEMKEKIDWLIASFYEQGRKEVTLREKIGRQETTLLNLAQAVRSLCETQAQWKSIMDQLAGVLAQAKPLAVPAPPEITTG